MNNGKKEAESRKKSTVLSKEKSRQPNRKYSPLRKPRLSFNKPLEASRRKKVIVQLRAEKLMNKAVQVAPMIRGKSQNQEEGNTRNARIVH